MMGLVLPELRIEGQEDRGAEMARRLAEALHPNRDEPAGEPEEVETEIDAVMTFSDREQLRSMGKGDALIAISFPPFGKETLYAMRVAQQNDVVAAGPIRHDIRQPGAQRAAIGSMHPGRVDVIGAGSLVLDRVMRRFGFTEVVVSEHDILDGIAWSMVPGVTSPA